MAVNSLKLQTEKDCVCWIHTNWTVALIFTTVLVLIIYLLIKFTKRTIIDHFSSCPVNENRAFTVQCRNEKSMFMTDIATRELFPAFNCFRVAIVFVWWS
jgi:hypothetical protein